MFSKNQVQQGKGSGKFNALVRPDGASFVMAKMGKECISNIKGVFQFGEEDSGIS